MSADEKVGVGITTVLTRYNWASFLLTRDRLGDKEKARSVLGRAAELCAAYDLAGMADRVGALAADRL